MKSVFIYLLSNITNGLLPLALLPLFTEHLTPTEYGYVTLFQMFFIFFRAISGSSYVTSSERNYFSKGFDNNSYVNTSFFLIIITSLFLFLLICFFSNSISAVSDLKIEYVFLSFASGVFAVVIQLRLSQWLVRKKAIIYGVLQVMIGLSGNILAIIFVVNLGMGVEGRVDSIFYTYLIFSLICIYSLYKDGCINFRRWSTRECKDILYFSLPLLPHSLGVLLLTVFDRLVLKINLGVEIVGIYMVGFQLMSAVGILSDAFNKFFSPIQMELLSAESTESKKLLVKYIYIWSLAISLCGFVANIALCFFVKSFLDIKYHEVTKVIPWLALGQVFNGIYISILNIVYYSKNTAALSFSTMVVSAVHILVFYTMTKYFGIEGAGIAFSISMAIRLMFTFILSSVVLPLPWVFRYKC
ncbi:oligosaccharide flippase family protein [Pseudoalteromonas sp. PS5]|uniref:lipopolysaccharide biosynthesis protein n=1 Tax=Pseudoalteromonas sp. PS5 TaxID=1437473 RepID=UPI000FFEC844|nr:oligosaccharide flippase family protein [Pseudoalteromonas sp. PS5]RXF01989.1 hypothetical protein D9603_12170 [Pseudoalteromonas sp. PS5]